MKAILVLCLLASISCVNYIETLGCVITNPKVISLAGEVIKTIKSKEFEKLIPLAIQSFSELKDIVTKCLNPRDEVVLKESKCYHPIRFSFCIGKFPTKELIDYCDKQFCKKK